MRAFFINKCNSLLNSTSLIKSNESEMDLEKNGLGSAKASNSFIDIISYVSE